MQCNGGGLNTFSNYTLLGLMFANVIRIFGWIGHCSVQCAQRDFESGQTKLQTETVLKSLALSLPVLH